MSAKDEQVDQILARTLAQLDAIRTEDNGEDENARRKAHETFAKLFAHGMVDRWVEEDGREQPTPKSWDWNCEPLAPNPKWGPNTTARFHRVLGDLNLLHSNDAGLNAAKDNYESAVRLLRNHDPASALLCYGRMLRAAAYASYGPDFLARHAAGLAWAVGTARAAAPSVRDEFEIALIECANRMMSAEDDELADSKLGDALRRVLIQLVSRDEELPFRRSLPWLAVASWAGTPMLSGKQLEPFLKLTGAKDVARLRLHAIDRAEKLEDGAFYPTGGALGRDEYKEGTRQRARTLRIGALGEVGDWKSVVELTTEALRALEKYEQQERVGYEATRLKALENLKDAAGWKKAASAFVSWLDEYAGDYWWKLFGVPDVIAALQKANEQLGDKALSTKLVKITKKAEDRLRGSRTSRKRGE